MTHFNKTVSDSSSDERCLLKPKPNPNTNRNSNPEACFKQNVATLVSDYATVGTRQGNPKCSHVFSETAIWQVRCYTQHKNTINIWWIHYEFLYIHTV